MDQTPAILLRKTPWAETSLIVTWLTERWGTIRTTARGARRQGNAFFGKLDIFYQADISFTMSRKGDLHSLREVMVTSLFDVGKTDHAGLYLGAYFAELAGHAAPSMHPAPEIFDLLQRGIAHLQKAPATHRALEHYERELCRISGVHDSSGSVTSLQALVSLCGSIPRSRAAALQFLRS